ncbi:cohesin domain-containing protein [Patescibacteria group bacterium]|nr:cohesin domain-containing protein [Patescibacteria group bacterium]
MKKSLILNNKALYTSLFLIGLFIVSTNVAHAGATLFLSPSSGSLTVGDSISTTVVVNTGGDPINAVQATASFPTDLLEITGVSKAGLFTLWPIEPAFSNSVGTMNFAGGLPNPGYTGTSGSIITMTFKGIKAGTATVTLGSVSILKNDGLGTNIFTGAGSATFTISEPPATPIPSPTPTPEPEPEPEPTIEVLPAPVVYSDTHPKQDIWYIDPSPEFYWDKLEGAEGFSYSFDDEKNSIPDDESEGTENKAKFENTEDGVWYFHVKVLNEGGWSEIAHYRVQIDTTPPLEFDIRLEGENPTKLREPKVHFTTIDELSGIDRYELLLDTNPYAILEVGETEPFTFSEIPYGSHTTEVQAYDKAGNIRSSSFDFEIIKFAPESGFMVGSYFVLFSWLALALLIIILALIILILFFFFICCRRRKDDDEEEDENQKKKKHWRKMLMEKIKKYRGRPGDTL